jgi:Flp pilus assembly protein TadG
MKRSYIRRSHVSHPEAGITMALVALAMVAIIGMAVMSIDVVTLYLAKEEAQRSADGAALAAARVIAVSGITGDPTNASGNWGAICGTSGIAKQQAKAVAAQNHVGSQTAPTATVTYSAVANGSIGSGTSDCTSLSATEFAVNPVVNVQVTQTGLPNFFSRFWGRSGNSISAMASAEVFNPSNSDNANGGTVIPVQPRCVKPIVIPNLDPMNPNGCNGPGTCQPLVSTADGQITNPGISLNGTNSSGVIGERFLLVPNCRYRTPSYCQLRNTAQPANFPQNGNSVPGSPANNLLYLPGQTVNSSVAVPSAASAGDLYEQALAGCDNTTVYYCGVPGSSPIGNGPNMVDVSANPGANGNITNGIMALIHEGNPNPNGGQPTGQDTLNPYALPVSYPFQILAGSSNPQGLTSGTPISSSISIASVPIYDTANVINASGTSAVTIVGFLQVFINGVDQYGNVDVTVLNVSGCGNGSGTVGTAVAGNSPVPIRLITPP